MDKAKVKLIIAALIFALLVGGGVYFVKDRGLVTAANEYEKQFEFVFPTEVVYAEENKPVDELYVQPTEVWIKNTPNANARVYSAFCDENFQGRYVILDVENDWEENRGKEYIVRCVDREEFKEFFLEHANITTPGEYDIFDEAEMTPMWITSYLTKSEGTFREESSLLGQCEKWHAWFLSADQFMEVDGIPFDYDGSEKYLSGIDVTFGDTAEYRQHFKDSKFDIVFSDMEIVRLIESKDLLCLYSDGASFVAVVDATVSCNRNDGIYKDLAWIPEAGHQNRVRFMTTCYFNIIAMEDEPITNHMNWMTSLGVYGYEPL